MSTVNQETFNVLSRPSIGRNDTANIARSSRTLLAVAVTAGIYAHTATAPALADDQESVEAYLADLVDQTSSKQSEVDNILNQMGGIREAANKSRVDLERSQKAAQEAQDKTLSARKRLDSAEKDVNTAQEKLNEIARSAYKQGGHTAPVTLAAGADSAASQMDRASYVRLATEKQQGVVNRLDLSRTQSANEESRLRASREAADNAVQNAVKAHQTAVDTLRNSQQRLQQISAEYQKLKRQAEQAQAKLRAAKSAIETLANQKPKASSFEKRAAAEKAANLVEKKAEKDSDKKSEQPSAPQQNTPQTEEATSGNNTAESTAASTETQAPSEAPTPDTAVIAAPETPATFEQSNAGDDHRQKAIDGLIAAGQDAFRAGATATANGQDRAAALRAAGEAGRNTAGQHYDQLVANAGSAQTAQTAPSATEAPSQNQTATTPATTPESAQEPAEQQAEQTAEAETQDQSDNPAQQAESQGILINPETGLQEERPGEMPPVTAPDNDNLPAADTTVDTSGTAEEKIERVIDRAMSQLGVQYAWGGGNANGPTLGIRDWGVADTYGDYQKIGFDCSGLTLYAFAAVGLDIGHYTGYQYNQGRKIPVSEIKRGDMLFWGPNAEFHVAIYLGDGKMIEAPQSGDVVKISDVRYNGMSPYAVRMIE
ncbi:DIP1281 family NlpC/P60 protein [Corynebacterium sp. MSK039]|uniref:DIP1281 family NlpC/P60 protein n=1 Tax=Corynebacterium sp. MSK039 TaxID=3050193 RepID=UPI00254AD4B9|nr:NlpC/P60 family protein [Corynebacterium sp. MSK039]MDK8790199.1 NlpC/P60 family protein [Corynebacterium sp. MSK039]